MNQIKTKILIADDNKDFCDMLEHRLNQEADFEVVAVAADGTQAYQKIFDTQPDIALIDSFMPRLDGLGLLEKLNAQPPAKRPVFILLSSLCHEKISQRAFELGADYYIVKPFDMDSLISRIRQFQQGAQRRPIAAASASAVLEAPEGQSAYQLEAKVTAILHDIGVPAHIRGYHYMREAIIMAVNDMDVLNGKDILYQFPAVFDEGRTVTVLKRPKTKSSIRTVYLPDHVLDALQEWKGTLKPVKRNQPDLILRYSNGRPLSEETLPRLLEKQLLQLRLPVVSFHSLRHSSISYKLVLTGGNIKAVQGDSGHAQAEMITERYGHIIDTCRRQCAQDFEIEFYKGM